MVCNSHSEMNESPSLQCGRPRSNSEPIPRQVRRNSIVLTPAVLNEYARGEEDAAMFKRQYERAYFNVYGSPTPLNNVAATDVTIPGTDQTVYSRYFSDPRLNALGFFDFRRRSASRCSSNSWTICHVFTMLAAGNIPPNIQRKLHRKFGQILIPKENRWQKGCYSVD